MLMTVEKMLERGMKAGHQSKGAVEEEGYSLTIPNRSENRIDGPRFRDLFDF